MMDLVMLFTKVCYIILISMYRIVRPKPLKSLYGEVAMVISQLVITYYKYRNFCTDHK